MKVGLNNVRGIRIGAKSVRAYLGSELILPKVTITGEWKPGMTDKNVRAVISGEVNLLEKVDAYSVDFEANAVLTIKGGARLRVWEGGCNTNTENNLIIEAEEGNMGQFLFNPTVATNRHPHAIVQLISKGRGSGAVWQRFGVPALNGLTAPQIQKVGHSYTTYYDYWDNTINDWKRITDRFFVMKPFQGLAMTSNAPAVGTKYAFPCDSLYGNTNAPIKYLPGWNYISNSYTAEIDTRLLLEELAKYGILRINVKVPSTDNTWEEQTLDNITIPYIEPITGIFSTQYQGSSPAEVAINYQRMVWDASFRRDAEELAAQSRGTKRAKKSTHIVLGEKVLEGTPMENPKVPADFEEK